MSGDEVARIRGKVSKDELERVVKSFLLGGERTPTQDIRYHFQQLTDVIIRALSPGINDPFTAVNGIDELTSAIPLLAKCARPADRCCDDKGVVRVLIPRAGIGEILEETVGHITIYAAKDRFVMSRLGILLDRVERHLREGPDRETLLRLRVGLNR